MELREFKPAKGGQPGMPTAIAAAAPPADADVPAADDVSGAAAAATLFGGSAAAAEEANAAGAARGAKVPSALLFQHGSCQSSTPDLSRPTSPISRCRRRGRRRKLAWSLSRGIDC